MSGPEQPAGDGPSREAALDALVAVAARLSAAERLAPASGDAALRALAEAAVALIRAVAASVALYDGPTGRLVFRAAAGPEGQAVVGLSIAAHEGIAGYAYSTGQALAIADVSSDPRFGRATAERTGYLPRSLLAVPLVDDAGIIGVMEILDRRDALPFDFGDVEVATRLAAATTAVARAGRVERDAGRLLRAGLAGVAHADDDTAFDEATVEALLTAASEGLDDDDPLWRLADRIGRLRAADPEDVELAVAWLDALLVNTERRGRGGGRSRSGSRA
jgi:GAF domain-containing protein